MEFGVPVHGTGLCSTHAQLVLQYHAVFMLERNEKATEIARDQASHENNLALTVLERAIEKEPRIARGALEPGKGRRPPTETELLEVQR